MIGKLKKVADILHSQNTYTIPPYQRQYQWNSERWQSLISDVSNAKNASIGDPEHWLGIVLLSRKAGTQFPGEDSEPDYSVIDGQQRIVTLIIWLAALLHHATDAGQHTTLKIVDLPKLKVQVSDRKPLEIAIMNRWQEQQFESLMESQILRAYRYFRYVLWLGEDALLEEYECSIPSLRKLQEGESQQIIWEKFVGTTAGQKIPRGNLIEAESLIDATLNRLSIFSLVHDPSNDEPVATIFDTLNGMRTELEPLDHVRNSIFVRLSDQNAENLFRKYWAPAEEGIRDVRIRGMKPGISFLYDFVISKGERKRQGTISRLKGASHFARMTRDYTEKELSTYLVDEVIPAMLCWPVVIRKRDSVKYESVEIHFTKRSIELMDSVRDLSKNPANPLVLLYITARVRGKLTDKQLESRLFLIETFLARQILAMTPLSPLRARIMDIASEIDGDIAEAKLSKALRRHMLETDNGIKIKAKKAEYGNLEAAQLGALFRGIEKELSGRHAMNFKISPTNYTIEHIYPRKDEKWQSDLRLWGTDSKKMGPYLQALGNLTVVSKEHNSRVGNSRFRSKIQFPLETGNAAPLGIHKDWLRETQWTEKEIQKRTLNMLNRALKHWPRV